MPNFDRNTPVLRTDPNIQLERNIIALMEDGSTVIDDGTTIVEGEIVTGDDDNPTRINDKGLFGEGFSLDKDGLKATNADIEGTITTERIIIKDGNFIQVGDNITLGNDGRITAGVISASDFNGGNIRGTLQNTVGNHSGSTSGTNTGNHTGVVNSGSISGTLINTGGNHSGTTSGTNTGNHTGVVNSGSISGTLNNTVGNHNGSISANGTFTGTSSGTHVGRVNAPAINNHVVGELSANVLFAGSLRLGGLTLSNAGQTNTQIIISTTNIIIAAQNVNRVAVNMTTGSLGEASSNPVWKYLNGVGNEEIGTIGVPSDERLKKYIQLANIPDSDIELIMDTLKIKSFKYKYGLVDEYTDYGFIIQELMALNIDWIDEFLIDESPNDRWVSEITNKQYYGEEFEKQLNGEEVENPVEIPEDLEFLGKIYGYDRDSLSKLNLIINDYNYRKNKELEKRIVALENKNPL